MPATFGYWRARGMGQSICLLLEYTGTEYVDKRYDVGPAPDYDRSQWLNDKFNLGMDLPNLPYYIDDAHKVTQSKAILRYIGRKHGMCGSTEEEVINVDMLENQAMDFRMAFYKLCYFSNNYELDKATYVKETLPSHLKLLSDFMGSNKWFIGNKISFVDFLFYELFDINNALAPGCLKDFQNLQDFVARFESLDAIKKYMNSSRFIKGPINGPMAAFVGN